MGIQKHISDNNWWKWGIASKRFKVSDFPRLYQLLHDRFNLDFNSTHTETAEFSIVGNDENVSLINGVFSTKLPGIKITTDLDTRLSRSLGKSYADLLLVLDHIPVQLPDAVIFPGNHEEVIKILNVCSEDDILVVPFGGGSNVVGAFNRKNVNKPCVMLDMSQMKKLLNLDVVNHTAFFEAGIFGPDIESSLNKEGFTLGHFPQSFEFSALGGWIATHSAGQESSGYGRIEDMVVALKVATPKGTISTGDYEHDAEGVNLRHLFYGSEGMFGVITEALVCIQRLPENKKWLVALFPSFETGTEAVRKIVQKNIHPAVVRYSDEQETFFLQYVSHKPFTFFSKIKSFFNDLVLRSKGIKSPSILLIRFDGDKEDIFVRSMIAAEIIRKHKGFLVGEKPGRKWEHARFDLPYLRDDLLENGILVDTMETVLPWDKINTFKQELLAELQKSAAFGYDKGILMSHLSHVYNSCCSIYFTVITARDTSGPLAQWEEIKKIVTDFIVRSGGAVSHHHSIGRMHQSWYVKKTDALTLEILCNLKKTCDPKNILNPGKLYDE
ncbi:MAG TPA: FAD-binding oxidoreductase [Bacteroidales bacterium]|nr:FAD-binding oxidoreductase [Bacteroidales bacterium]